MPLLATQKYEFSSEWSLGLEENVQLLPTFLIRKSHRSGPCYETALPHSYHDRWLISAVKQEDMVSTPLKHTCKHMLCDTLSYEPSLSQMDTGKLSLPHHTVYRVEDRTHPVLKQRKYIRITV